MSTDTVLADAQASAVEPICRVIRLVKESGRMLDPSKNDLQISSIMSESMSSERTRRGWTLAYAVNDPATRYTVVGEPGRGYFNYVELIAECRPTRLRSTIGQEFQNIVAAIDLKAQLPRNRWAVHSVDGERYVPTEVTEIKVNPDESIGYAPFAIPADEAWDEAFGHLYGLDAQIGIVRSALELGDASSFRKRANVALIGDPGCGKSDLCATLKRLLGEESVLEFDGTSTTMAGAQRELAEREELPRVLLVEEIEKAPEASLSWLLSILDIRGEVRKTTARGNVMRDTRMIAICTVNDETIFSKIAYGALYSRFVHKVHFQRPSRDLLAKILKREIADIGGDESWIAPALDYAEEIGCTDPREVIAICLCGGDQLLDGRYQRMLRATRRPSAPVYDASQIVRADATVL